MLLHGSVLFAAVSEGERRPLRITAGNISGKLFVGLAHPFSGDQNHRRADDQHRADHIEDGGADTAGGGQRRTGSVLNIRAQTACLSFVNPNSYAFIVSACVLIGRSDLELYRLLQQIVTSLTASVFCQQRTLCGSQKGTRF